MQRSALCRSRRELSNAYLLAKVGFDTAENEPSKASRAPKKRRDEGRLDSPAGGILVTENGLAVPDFILPTPKHSRAKSGKLLDLTEF